MKRRRRRRWPWLAVLLLAAGGAGWWYFTQKKEKAAAPQYETATIERGDLTKVVTASGSLNPLVKVEIGSQISGTIASLNVDFNSPVKEGDVLCQLDPATYKANHDQAVAENASAEAERDLQKRTLERKELLLNKNVFAKADFDKAEADLQRAEAQVSLAKARIQKASVDLARCTIFAPIDGVVVDRTAEIGQTIAASFNAPKLFVLANDLTKMQINAKVSEAHVGQVKPGQKVEFVVDAYEETFTGEVVQVRNSPIAEENVVNYDAIIAVNNPDLKLKPGMNTEVSIVTGERSNVLIVPNSALRFRPPTPEESRRGRSPAMAGGGRREGGGGRSSGGRDGAGRDGGGREGGGRTARSQTTPVSLRSESPRDEQKEVYLAAGSTGDAPKPVKIRVGLNDGVKTEVVEGLSEGDVVVTLLKQPEGEAPEMNNPFGGMGGRRRR